MFFSHCRKMKVLHIPTKNMFVSHCRKMKVLHMNLHLIHNISQLLDGNMN